MELRHLRYFITVAASMGVAIVPASLQNLQRAGVIYKAVQEPTPEVAIAMIWREHDLSPTVQRFLEVVGQVTQQWQAQVG